MKRKDIKKESEHDQTNKNEVQQENSAKNENSTISSPPNKELPVQDTNDATDDAFAKKFNSLRGYFNDVNKDIKRKKKKHSRKHHEKHKKLKPTPQTSSEIPTAQIISNTTPIISNADIKIIDEADEGDAFKEMDNLSNSDLNLTENENKPKGLSLEQIKEIKQAEENNLRKLLGDNIKQSFCDVAHYGRYHPGIISFAYVPNEKGEMETIAIIASENALRAWNMTNFDKNNQPIWSFEKPETLIKPKIGRYINYSYRNQLWIQQEKVIFVCDMQITKNGPIYKFGLDSLPDVENKTAIFVIDARNKKELLVIQDEDHLIMKDQNGEIMRDKYNCKELITANDIIPNTIRFEKEDNCLIYKLQNGKIMTHTLLPNASEAGLQITFNGQSFGPQQDHFFLTSSQYIVDIVASDDSSNFTIIDRNKETMTKVNTGSKIHLAYLCSDLLICSDSSISFIIDLVTKKIFTKKSIVSNESTDEKEKNRLTKVNFLLDIIATELKNNANFVPSMFFQYPINRLLSCTSKGNKSILAFEKDGRNATISLIVINFENMTSYKFIDAIQFEKRIFEKLKLQLQLKDDYLIVNTTTVRDCYLTTDINVNPIKDNTLQIWDLRTQEKLLGKGLECDFGAHIFEKDKLMYISKNKLYLKDYNVSHNIVNNPHPNSVSEVLDLKPWRRHM